MLVNIEVASWFRRFTGDKTEFELEVLEGCLAFEAICLTGIPKDEIGFVTLIGIDEGTKLVDDSYRLTEGDRLRVFPLLIGG